MCSRSDFGTNHEMERLLIAIYLLNNARGIKSKSKFLAKYVFYNEVLCIVFVAYGWGRGEWEYRRTWIISMNALMKVFGIPLNAPDYAIYYMEMSVNVLYNFLSNTNNNYTVR